MWFKDDEEHLSTDALTTRTLAYRNTFGMDTNDEEKLEVLTSILSGS